MMKFAKWLRFLLCLPVWAASVAFAVEPLKLEDVLQTVRTQYPPLLVAWLQQDVTNGAIRQSQGAFDPTLLATLNFRPLDYYGGSNLDLMVEQPLLSGGSVYGGYRASQGKLASYDRKYRTSHEGEGVLGVKVPLLRDREIDSRRANLGKAEVDRELADPLVLRQYVNVHRGARIAYYNWIALGKKLRVAEQLLGLAKSRENFLRKQLEVGAIAAIVEVDNRRLVVSRELAVLGARRRFEAACIELSLFHRDGKTGEPILPTRGQLPREFPEMENLSDVQLVSERGRAAFRRPEVREIELRIRRGGIDRLLANNALKPNLDLALELNQAIGNDVPSDIEKTELTGMLKFSVPIGRNEAKGRLEMIDASIRQLEKQRQFAREQIYAEASNTFQEVRTAYDSLAKTRENVALAGQLEAAESERFAQGASDLLALQLREQAMFEAKNSEIDAQYAFFKAMADYQAAVAIDAPESLWRNAVKK